MKQAIFTAILIFAFCFMAFAQTNINVCPEINLVLPNKLLVPDKPVIFIAKVAETPEKYNLNYEWTFSRGKILNGQGTPRIEFVASEDDEASNITVTVKVIGLLKECLASDIFSVIDIPDEDPLDEFRKINLNTYKHRLDNFLISVIENPNSEGLIELKFNKKDSRSYKKSLLKTIQKHLEFRKFDLTRITIAILEEDFEERTILWIIPLGAKLPHSVTKEYKIIKAEELEQKINELFPKK